MPKVFPRIAADGYGDEALRELWLRADAMDRAELLAGIDYEYRTVVQGSALSYPAFVEPAGGPGVGVQDHDDFRYFSLWLRSDADDPPDDIYHYHPFPGTLGTSRYKFMRAWITCYGEFAVWEGAAPEVAAYVYRADLPPETASGQGPFDGTAIDEGQASQGPVPDAVWGQRYAVAPVLNIGVTRPGWGELVDAYYPAREDKLALRTRNLWAVASYPARWDNALVHVVVEAIRCGQGPWW